MIPIRREWSAMKRLALLSPALAVPLEEATASGNPVVFQTDVKKPLKSLLIPFTPVQSGTGDPSPQNIRSILPWNGLKVWNGGKNLFDGTIYRKNVDYNTGAISTSTNRLITDYIPLKAGKYTFSIKESAQITIYFYKEPSKSGYVKAESLSSWVNAPRTFTITEDRYVVIVIRNPSNTTILPSDVSELQLEVGQTASPYEEYTPITETDISFPSPVYGGTLDVVSGVLTVDKAYQLLNDADKWTQLTAGQTVDFSYEQDFERKLYDGSLTGLTCSAFPAVVNQNVAFCRWRGATSLKFGIKNGNSMATPLTLAEVKQMATEGQIAICYDIEPQTVTLTPEQITALKGENTIWSDADGSMTAVYLKKK